MKLLKYHFTQNLHKIQKFNHTLSKLEKQALSYHSYGR